MSRNHDKPRCLVTWGSHGCIRHADHASALCICRCGVRYDAETSRWLWSAAEAKAYLADEITALKGAMAIER